MTPSTHVTEQASRYPAGREDLKILKRSWTEALTLTVGLFLIGCATPSPWMVNPINGQMVRCASTGWGYVGAPMAVGIHDQCVRDYGEVGYVELPDVQLGLHLAFADGNASITSITPSTGAVHSGIRVGDRLKTLNAVSIKNYGDMVAVLKDKHPGESAAVVVERDGKLLEFAPILQRR